jgi:hypothetical protein
LDRVSVSSSNIASVGYNDQLSLLEVEFHSGGIYQYADVPRVHFDSMTSGLESVGKYFHKHIKNNYTFTKVGK